MKAVKVLFVLFSIIMILYIDIRVYLALCVISFIYATRYTYLCYKAEKAKRRRRKKNRKRRKSVQSKKSTRKKTTQNSKRRTTQGNKQTVKRNYQYTIKAPEKKTKATVYVEPNTELSVFERALLGQPISLEEIDALDGVDFEAVLYNRFKGLGFQVYYTPASGDFGADLIVETDGVSTAVQVKRYDHKRGRVVGVKAVQEAFGAQHYYGTKTAIVITNATFTANARELARSVKTVFLWDREELKKTLGFI